MPAAVEHHADHVRLVMTGTLGVTDARSLHALLLGVVDEPGRIVLDDANLAQFDTSLVQLVLAFTAARRTRSLDTALAGGPLLARLHALGVSAVAPAPETA